MKWPFLKVGPVALQQDRRAPSAPCPLSHDQAPRSLLTSLAAILLLLATAVSSAASDTDPIAFFEKRVRPVLIDHCYPCHSAQAEKVKGGLSLDSRDGLLQGGDLGPSILPGDPEKSLLIQAVRHASPDLQMPPKKGKLSDRQIADLTVWVKAGAPWPDNDPAVASRPSKPGNVISEADREWWAFLPIVPPPIPAGAGIPQDTHPIDAFIRSRLLAKALQPNPPANRRDLIRRAYFDLIGLPPAPEEVAAFEQDASPQAWPRLIDQLLARPEFGERWARHWLDIARFAQSSGYERDGEKPYAWRFRDYVVRAFNDDKPYDQFVREQIAGDLIEPFDSDATIATAFHRLGVWDDEPDDKRMAEFDELDDVLSTTASAFLGLTLGCARCHDHKFDPFPQTDYYRLLGYFRNIHLNEPAKYSLSSGNYLPLADVDVVATWQSLHESRLRPLREQLAVATEESYKSELSRQIAAIEGEPAPWEWTLGVRERHSAPPPTHVLIRGNAGTPGPQVQPGFPAVLSPREKTDSPPPISPSGARRLELAQWIASPQNPLTARVLVNRVWQHLFGRGIVATPSDFGRAGSPPTHPELLQWLANDFVRHGWSLKHLHRTILLSQTYQQSTQTENPAAQNADPANTLLWRQNLRRLEAESMRDTFLTISGQLNPKMGGRGFFPRLSGEVLAGQSRPGLDWEISSPSELARRSLYTYVRRTMMVPILETFDYNNTTSPLGDRPVTTVAPQALLLLNDAFLHEQASAFARRLIHESGPSRDAQIRRGFQLALGRTPSPTESRLASDYLDRQQQAFASIQGRITFRPDVPLSLSVDYMAKLRPEHFLVGPARGWSYHRGKWSGAYEGIRTLDRDQSPFALWTGAFVSNAIIEVKLLPHIAFETGGLLFRAIARDDVVTGYECTLEPREQRLELRRLGPPQTSVLASAPLSIPETQPIPLRLDLADDRIRIWVGKKAEPVIDIRDPNPLPTGGHLGIRAWGAALSLDDLTFLPSVPVARHSNDEIFRPSGQSTETVRDSSQPSPEHRALQSLCLMLLNLNEVVYIP